ncbi:MAG: glycosyltransferase [Halieaceae bacterium]|nr:glycosyltransferase [Halieaceae bacterium]
MSQLLVIGYVWPESLSTAAGSHMLSILHAFISQGWEITFASAAARNEQMDDLKSHNVTCVDIELNSSSFDKFVEQLQPSVVLFDRFMTEEQFGWRVEKSCPQALRVLDTEDLFCLRHARQQAFKDTGLINPLLSPSLLFSELAQREVASILRCDLSLIVSEVELQLLTELFKVAPSLLQYYPLCFSPEAIAQTRPPLEDRDGFIAIGNYRHPPNWDAVRWLAEAIWPEIRLLLPGAQCRIYGAYTPPKASALHKPEQGFHIMGWASDARTVMQSARVNLAPLRFGAGLKGKLAEAMLCGTPSITTSIGAEGMAGNLPFAGGVSDCPLGIASEAVALHQDEEQWAVAQGNGYCIVRQRFDQQIHNRGLFKRITQLQGQLDDHRLQNFTGAMLRHHQHKSTQYMSQWIEVKNRLAEQLSDN